MTYFDSWSGGKLTNDAVRDYHASHAGTIPPFGWEILNPSVQLFGDTAIFTFNLEVTDPASDTVAAVWNSTEVHRRTSNGWEIVHAHWSLPAPPPEG